MNSINKETLIHFINQFHTGYDTNGKTKPILIDELRKILHSNKYNGGMNEYDIMNFANDFDKKFKNKVADDFM
jgi:hypothetical protein